MYKLILADDEREVLEGIVKSIDWQSYNVEIVGTACDGHELMSMAQKFKPDVILTDIRMPQLDGLEAALQLRQLLKDTQFVFITAYEEFEYARKAIACGAVAFLTKPIFKSELEGELKKIVHKLDEKKSTISTPNKIFQKNTEPETEKLQIDAPIERAISYIDKNLESGVTLTEVAEYMNMNPSYFSRYFKESCNIGFIAYVKAQKIERAKEYLRNTNLKIYEISDRLGYSSVQYFTVIFKDNVGMTPVDYKMSKQRKCF